MQEHGFGQVRRAARPAGTQVELDGLFVADALEHGGQVLDAALVADGQHHGHGRDDADGRQLFLGVVVGLGVQVRQDRQRHIVEGQGIAVRRALLQLLHADEAARAARVLHHHRLAQLLAERGGDEPAQRVAGAARGEGHDDRDGPAGVVLRGGRGGQRCGSQGGAQDGGDSQHGVVSS
ncbi:hypothetical protein D9M69_590570 [compost metagenome]